VPLPDPAERRHALLFVDDCPTSIHSVTSRTDIGVPRRGGTLLKRSVVAALLLIASLQAQTVVATFDAPDTGITGLACGGGFLWAVDGTTRYMYKIDPASGAVLDSWYAEALPAAETPTGLAFGNNTLYVASAASTAGTISTYTVEGVYGTSFDPNC
jgi:hypothetical protein